MYRRINLLINLRVYVYHLECIVACEKHVIHVLMRTIVTFTIERESSVASIHPIRINCTLEFNYILV